jgi:hypothetical protein
MCNPFDVHVGLSLFSWASKDENCVSNFDRMAPVFDLRRGAVAAAMAVSNTKRTALGKEQQAFELAMLCNAGRT